MDEIRELHDLESFAAIAFRFDELPKILKSMASANRPVTHTQWFLQISYANAAWPLLAGAADDVGYGLSGLLQLMKSHWKMLLHANPGFKHNNASGQSYEQS
jgi:hypothetical protein